MLRLLAERSDTKFNVKLGGFRSQLQESYVSSHTEELWYNETVCLWMTMYIYIYIYMCVCVCVCVHVYSKKAKKSIHHNKIVYQSNRLKMHSDSKGFSSYIFNWIATIYKSW